MGESWHALDGGMGVFIRKSLPTRQGETVDRAHEREREREEEEREGWNLGRPAPRVPRKLGQVFCTCRSNAGTFATVFIILPFLFAITSPPPSPLPSPRCCLRFFFPRPACHASWKSFQKPSGKLMATNDDGSRLSSLFRSLDGDFFFFFLKWNVSIGSHDSPRYVIYSYRQFVDSRVCVGNAGFNWVKRISIGNE